MATSKRKSPAVDDEWVPERRKARVEQLIGLGDRAIAERLMIEGCQSTNLEAMRRTVNNDRREIESRWANSAESVAATGDPVKRARTAARLETIYAESIREFTEVTGTVVTETTIGTGQKARKIRAVKTQDRGGLRHRMLATALDAVKSAALLNGFDINGRTIGRVKAGEKKGEGKRAPFSGFVSLDLSELQEDDAEKVKAAMKKPIPEEEPN